MQKVSLYLPVLADGIDLASKNSARPGVRLESYISPKTKQTKTN